ncbi:DNA topoisomerase IB [Tunicatimonas pelagia]|uniref:DNA topoisomerase IB n=1 Tax=Tunicatimonas pelagia TaxID=931531 RepID=UPI002665C0E9|nr:DNA topoisomerase IB [Tunicatimonas pelagia]WKN44365.1 DNA topoisomerase IB [Tunicatimonas pelagia]
MGFPLMSGLPQGLIYQDDSQPGYLRKKWGRGHSYFDKQAKLREEKTLTWIQSLGIPPDWDDVWISKDPNGHLLATGYDAKGRKQYYYHPSWAEYRNKVKFDKLALFGRKLPIVRLKVTKDLEKRGWPKEKVLALILQVLDEYGIRIGNEQYKRENKTFGLTTLRRKHLDFEEGHARLEYRAKSGKYRKINIKQNQLVRLIKRCSELPGYEVFKYRGQDGKYHHIRSQDVNEYLQDIVGEQFTCKDFRTWHGTVTAIDKWKDAQALQTKNPRLKLETTIIKLVAKELGNTISVCRKYYIHPEVLKALLENTWEVEKELKIKPTHLKQLDKYEITALSIIS